MNQINTPKIIRLVRNKTKGGMANRGPEDASETNTGVLVLDNPVATPVFQSRRPRGKPKASISVPSQEDRANDAVQTKQIGLDGESVKQEKSENKQQPMSTTDTSLNIYTEYFGLKARPFSLVPDPAFIFWSPAHRRAFTMLEYGLLTRAPITLITGEIGAGKTTLLHHLLKTLDQNTKVALVSNAQGSRGDLLRWVLRALDQPASPDSTYVDLFDAFQSYLIAEYARGHNVVVIFDEAQNLSRESLEELRMFTNINSNKDELLQLVLVGQPELRDTILQPDLRQFAQRVASSFHLGTMDAETVHGYIGHRLMKSGARKNLFTRGATDLIHANTGGVPRLVNQLCDLSMVYTFTANQKIVTERTVQQVLDDGTFFCAGAFDRPNEPE